MSWLDFAKAAGLAALVLAIDVLVAIAVVFAWGMLVEPGHPRAYYETAGVPIARGSTRVVGTALVFAAAWLFSARKPERNPFLFSVALVVLYTLFDGASVAFAGFFTASVALTMSLKLLAALAGAFMALRTRRRSLARSVELRDAGQRV